MKKKTKSKKQTKDGVLEAHPLLHLPYIACGILIDIHKKPKHLDKLKKTACDIFHEHCTRKIKAIKPFKKKDGFDFAKEYKKWMAELEKLFIYYLNQDYTCDAWKEQADQISHKDNPLRISNYDQWEKVAIQHIRDLADKVFTPDTCRSYFERLSVEQVELHKRATKIYGLPPEWTYTKGIGVLAGSVLSPRKRSMAVEEYKFKAEAEVKKHGYQGLEKLLEAIGGKSRGTLTTAIKQSDYLKKVKKNYDAIPHKPRAAKPDDLNIVRHPRPTKPIPDDEIKKLLTKLRNDVERTKGPAEAKKFLEQIENSEKEAMARDYKEFLRKCDLENRMRKAQGKHPLNRTILDDFEENATDATSPIIDLL